MLRIAKLSPDDEFEIGDVRWGFQDWFVKPIMRALVPLAVASITGLILYSTLKKQSDAERLGVTLGGALGAGIGSWYIMQKIAE